MGIFSSSFSNEFSYSIEHKTIQAVAEDGTVYAEYNVEYPFVHTMHVRYILPVFVIGVPWVLEGIKYLVYKIPGAKTKKVCCGVGMGYVLTVFAVLQAYIIEILIQTDVIW